MYTLGPIKKDISTSAENSKWIRRQILQLKSESDLWNHLQNPWNQMTSSDNAPFNLQKETRSYVFCFFHKSFRREFLRK